MFSGMGVGNLLLIADGTANHKHGVQALNYYQTITGTKANGGGNNLDIITDLKTMRNTVKNACKNVLKYFSVLIVGNNAYTLGFAFSGAGGIYLSTSFGLAVDTQGNLGIYINGGVGAGTPGLSAGIS